MWYRASSSLFAYPTTIPDNYNDLPSNWKWTLATDSNGLYIFNESTDYVLTAPPIVAAGNLPTFSAFSSGEKQYWNITKAYFLSGYEVPEDLEKWNNFLITETEVVDENNNYYYDAQYYNNCYSYMLNHIAFSYSLFPFKMQPGLYDHQQTQGNVFIDMEYNFLIEKFISCVYEDSNSANFTFSPIGQYDICPEGTYKVALIYGANDYHWYRQNSDGSWSHKPGNTPATNLDYNGESIWDPIYASHDPGYTIFYGYFCVSSPEGNIFIW